MILFRPLASSAAALASMLAGGAALAQSSNYRSMEVTAGKPARIAVVTALKKDCSAGTIGGVKVVTVPKHGNLSLKKGKLKTPASFRCPNADTQAEAVFYQAKARFSGEDEIVYETKSADGVVERFTVKITISDKPATTAPATTTPAKKDEAIEL